MREQAALGHLEIFRKAADGQPFQSVRRCQIDGAIEDALPRAVALHAKAGRSLRNSVCTSRNRSVHGAGRRDAGSILTMVRAPRAWGIFPSSLEHRKP